MNNCLPLVTVLIATKDRAPDLRLTLQEMRKQRYPLMELLVIDDGSREPMEPVVREILPEATVIRHEKNAGQCARRNQGFALAKGKYILQLDDDCHLTGPADLERAVQLMEKMPQAGVVSCYLVNSPTLPPDIDTRSLKSGCVASFMGGGGSLFRKAAIDQTEGYRSFFGNEWEEEELALQLLAHGWRIVFAPEIVAHHRLSTLNRNSSRTWMRGLRNRLWALVIHMPASRLLPEISWKIAIGMWDAVRLVRPGLFLKALFEAAIGLPRVWRLRRPLSALAMRRYDALRLHPVLSQEEFSSPPAITWTVLADFARRWSNRARNRSVWSLRKDDTGTSYTIAYAHEHKVESTTNEGG